MDTLFWNLILEQTYEINDFTIPARKLPIIVSSKQQQLQTYHGIQPTAKAVGIVPTVLSINLLIYKN